ncbi:hypothetical protein T492DRAFT_1083341 [Pavlovales sp. CCMP2436]|nr:hypothetical protein T492DRAFT_1083341 [Pavlovales sp. CCMP2436]|mmetsp:Transcript_15716/g.40043  ORF Transcript_15716/g.40043 Transcript_15716/m.40043 type:complete len:170 (+) Transcript_15716:716-1225(+)
MAAHQLHESTKHHEAAEELPNYLSNAPPRPRPPKKAPGKKAYTLDDVLGIGKTSVWSLSLSEEFRTLISFECEGERLQRSSSNPHLRMSASLLAADSATAESSETSGTAAPFVSAPARGLHRSWSETIVIVPSLIAPEEEITEHQLAAQGLGQPSRHREPESPALIELT